MHCREHLTDPEAIDPTSYVRGLPSLAVGVVPDFAGGESSAVLADGVVASGAAPATPLLNSVSACPSEREISGRRLAPNTKIAIPRSKRRSWDPIMPYPF